MKPIFFACLCLTPFVVAKPVDAVDVKEVVTNRRLLVPYIKCVLDQGKCSPEGKELKAYIKEAIENYCAKCTPAQRTGTRNIIGHLINKEGDYWKQLTAKYDPDMRYTKMYEAELMAAKQKK